MDCFNLDVDFDSTMTEIKQNITFLENELDMMAISCWITRLSQPVCSIEEKLRRNEYLTYLSYMLKREMIHQPFTDEPPSGPLPPLNISMINPKCQPGYGFRETSEIPSSPGPSGYSHQTATPSITTDKRASYPCGTTTSNYSPRQSDATRYHSLSLGSEATSKGPEILRKSGSKEKVVPCSPCSKPKNLHLTKKPGEEDIGELPSPCPTIEKPLLSPPRYLEDCAEVNDEPFMSPLPGTMEADAQMQNIIDSVDQCTRLFDFIRYISPTVCDQGLLLNYVATSEISQFKEFVQSMYSTRMRDMEELLGKEQMKLKERYESWEISVWRRAKLTLGTIQRALPEFNYEFYKMDSDYLYFLLKAQLEVDDKDLHPQVRVLRLKAQKKRWLTDEVERMEKENEDRALELKDLNDQLNALSKCYNMHHKEFLQKNRSLEDKAAQLRIRFHQNQKLINALLDRINTVPCNY